MLSHESLKYYRLLPYCHLIEDEDCVFYNMDNLRDKLDRLLANPDKLEAISMSGHRKFIKSIDYRKLSQRLSDYIASQR